MDRAALQEMLDGGLSLAEIGRRVGRHEATVSYWLKKYDLMASNAARHAARGPLLREELEPLVAAGLSIAQIAARLDRSKPTVRHWLRRYALKTVGSPGRKSKEQVEAARLAGQRRITMSCPRHGETEFVIEGRGYFRCKLCRAQAVTRRRQRVKRILVEEAGGACQVCGYAANQGALHFHHLDPSSKRFEINARGAAIAIARLREEAAKCVLLCANCHAEAEAGLITLEAGSWPP